MISSQSHLVRSSNFLTFESEIDQRPERSASERNTTQKSEPAPRWLKRTLLITLPILTVILITATTKSPKTATTNRNYTQKHEKVFKPPHKFEAETLPSSEWIPPQGFGLILSRAEQCSRNLQGCSHAFRIRPMYFQGPTPKIQAWISSTQPNTPKEGLPLELLRVKGSVAVFKLPLDKVK